jgi:hypothetical protein
MNPKMTAMAGLVFALGARLGYPQSRRSNGD